MDAHIHTLLTKNKKRCMIIHFHMFSKNFDVFLFLHSPTFLINCFCFCGESTIQPNHSMSNTSNEGKYSVSVWPCSLECNIKVYTFHYFRQIKCSLSLTKPLISLSLSHNICAYSPFSFINVEICKLTIYFSIVLLYHSTSNKNHICRFI